VTGSVTSYSISPALPAGLYLNTSTGEITGLPSAVSAQASYTVTATGPGGSTSTTISITVNNVAPSSLSYSPDPLIYLHNVFNGMVGSPTVSGGIGITYSINPPLPGGLSMDTTTGLIMGTATSLSSTTSYTVTATNSAGSTSAGVSITIEKGAKWT